MSSSNDRRNENCTCKIPDSSCRNALVLNSQSSDKLDTRKYYVRRVVTSGRFLLIVHVDYLLNLLHLQHFNINFFSLYVDGWHISSRRFNGISLVTRQVM